MAAQQSGRRVEIRLWIRSDGMARCNRHIDMVEEGFGGEPAVMTENSDD